MIRHIVTWKLNATDEAGKAESFEAIAGVLRPLAGTITEISTLSINRNEAFHDVNWDVVLVGDYNSLDDLQAYQVHPAHVAAAAVVRTHVAQRASIDFEL